jgi:hypothetical protein
MAQHDLDRRAKEFWKWVGSHEQEVFFERDTERIFDAVHQQLRRVNEDLCFEFGPIENGRREFTITAEGISSAFDAVRALVRNAPSAPWNVRAFRQRQRPLLDVRVGEVDMKAEDVSFAWVQDGGQIAIILYIPGMKHEPERLRMNFLQVGYLLLDAAVGEFDVTTRISGIEMKAPEEDPDYEKSPLLQLADLVDSLKVN